MEPKLDCFDEETLLDKSKMLTTIERIVEGLLTSSVGEEDLLSALFDEWDESGYSGEKEGDVFSLVTKNKLHYDIEVLFESTTTKEERSFLSLLIIQLALTNPHLIYFYYTNNTIDQDRISLINSLEIIRGLWNDYAASIGNGNFSAFVKHVLEDPACTEDMKESFLFLTPSILFDTFHAYHLTIKPKIEGSQVYNQDARPSILIWIPSNPEFKLVVEFWSDFFELYLSGESGERDKLLQSEGYRTFMVDFWENSSTEVKRLCELLVAYSK